jgi:hypothetical protein
MNSKKKNGDLGVERRREGRNEEEEEEERTKNIP